MEHMFRDRSHHGFPSPSRETFISVLNVLWFFHTEHSNYIAVPFAKFEKIVISNDDLTWKCRWVYWEMITYAMMATLLLVSMDHWVVEITEMAITDSSSEIIWLTQTETDCFYKLKLIEPLMYTDMSVYQYSSPIHPLLTVFSFVPDYHIIQWWFPPINKGHRNV